MKRRLSYLLLAGLLGSSAAFAINQNEIKDVKADDDTVFFTEDYKTLALSKSSCYSYDHMAGGNSATHTLVPGAAWGDPFNATDGYIIYHVVANDGKAFETLLLDVSVLCRSDLVLKDGTPIQNAGFEFYIGDSVETIGTESVYSITPWKGSSTFKDYTIDFSTYADGLSSVFVKILLKHDIGSVTLNNCSAKLGSVKFHGTEKESQIAYVTKTDDYMNSSANCNFDTVYRLGGFQNSNGLVPTDKWGGTVNLAENGYLIYSLNAPVGATLRTLSVNINGRIWSGGTGTNASGATMTTAGCNIKLYISSDKNNFGEAVKVFAPNGAGATNFSYVDNEKCLNHSGMFIKIELNHPVMTCSLSQIGTRIYKAEISGSYDKRECIDSTPLDQSTVLVDNYKGYEQSGVLSPVTIDGNEYIYCSSGDKASIVLPISCNTLYNFYNITFTQLVRCTVYSTSEPFKDALTYSVSLDGKTFTKVEALDTDSGWARKSITLNLSEQLRGAHKAFIKVDYDWHGKTYSHDWLAIGNFSIKGDLVDRNSFDIIYYNMEGATNNPLNPQSYNYGESVTLLDPTRENYNFDGWYLDPTFETPFVSITTETKDDVKVYAKWEPTGIVVTLNAGDGEFPGGSKTSLISGSYDLGLSRSSLPVPTSATGNFINWFKDDEFTTPFNFVEDYGETDVITEPITLYAKYGSKAVVTYKYNDGVTSDVVFYQEVGQKASTVTQPTLSGNKFGCWEENGQAFDFDSSLTGDVTLTAHWYNICNITYEGLTNATNSNPSTYTSDLENIVLADPVRPGYTFKGWLEDGKEVTEIDTSRECDITLTATWEIITYQFSVSTDSHVSVVETPTSITYEGLTLEVRVEVGYRIQMATANNKSLVVNYDGTIFVGGFAENVEVVIETVESNYYDGSFDINFKNEVNLQDNVYDINNMTQYKADSSSSRYGYLTVQDHSRPGYIVYAIDVGEGKSINSLTLTGRARVFSYNKSPATLNLYFSTDGVNYTLINEYPSTTNGEAMTDINVNLTSQVKGQRFAYIKYVMESGNYDWVCLGDINASMSYTCSKVRFMDGENVMMINNDQITGGNITLIDNPTKEGYTFLGWYLDSNFRNRIDSSYIVEEDMDVYAKWEANTYNITYVVGEGADIGDNVETYTTEDDVILSEANKHNYKFVGWYLNESFTGDPITELPKGTTGDKTLYAKFVEGTPINYVLGGGENSELNPEVYFSDEETELFDAYRSGYVFGGWYLDSSFTTMVTSIEEGTEGEVTLYAFWIEDSDTSDTSKGCGSSIIASTAIVSTLSLVGMALVSKKRKEN